jgi:hypothetical protein
MDDTIPNENDEVSFETLAGAKKLVAWFWDQGFADADTAPRFDNDWAVKIFSTEEGLRGFPVEPDVPCPSDGAFKLAAAIINGEADEEDGLPVLDSDYVGSSGLWWEGWRREDFDDLSEIETDHP